ncbi:penicillin-binding protein 2, partial [candidate division WWE3 bacterium]|nr:penicillin-binding protein 2 [candidate division WWE3 bacterium]
MDYLERIQLEEFNKVKPKGYKKKFNGPNVALVIGTGEWRAVPYLILTIFLLVVLTSKAFVIQVIQGSENLALSEGNSIRYSMVRAERGVIYDRNGEVIARNNPGFSVELNTTECEDKCEKEIFEIAGLVTVDLEQIKTALKKRPSQVTLASGLTRDEIIKIESRLGKLAGVSTQVDPVRYYPFPEEFAHLLGYIGEGEDGDKMGFSGVEKQYDRQLRGVSGSRIIQVNSSGTYYTQIAEEPSSKGNNLQLYVDSKLQKASYAALKEAVEKSRAYGGAIIASDPNTGGVLAMASYPSFNSNLFATGISQGEYNKLAENPNKPFFNRPISATYPPGSTFKMLTALSALKSGVINKDSLVGCPGAIAVGSYIFRDWYPGGRGEIDLKRALQVSCDTYFYGISGGFGAQKGAGMEKMVEWARHLGLGKIWGIDLDGESAGFFPSPQWKLKERGEQWYLGDTYITAIGQGDILATPLQVNVFTSYFASRGKVYRPKAVKNVEGEAETKPEPVINDSSAAEHIDAVREGLKLALESGGTAWPFFDFGEKHKGIV